MPGNPAFSEVRGKQIPRSPRRPRDDNSQGRDVNRATHILKSWPDTSCRKTSFSAGCERRALARLVYRTNSELEDEDGGEEGFAGQGGEGAGRGGEATEGEERHRRRRTTRRRTGPKNQFGAEADTTCSARSRPSRVYAAWSRGNGWLNWPGARVFVCLMDTLAGNIELAQAGQLIGSEVSAGVCRDLRSSSAERGGGGARRRWRRMWASRGRPRKSWCCRSTNGWG